MPSARKQYSNFREVISLPSRGQRVNTGADHKLKWKPVVLTFTLRNTTAHGTGACLMKRTRIRDESLVSSELTHVSSTTAGYKVSIQRPAVFLDTNNKLSEKEIKQSYL